MGSEREEIAVVGMSCRFPGAADPDQYWALLRDGRDLIGEIGDDRFDTEYFLHRDPAAPGKSYTFSAGVLDGVDRFDAEFFGISPREAAQMDPQQRLLLELAWEALEDGGQVPEKLAGSDCAVLVGISSPDYGNRRLDDMATTDAYYMTGSALSIAANRISYVFDLHGPSLAIDTACSSSLVALHYACQSLWSGESSMALAGGVHLLLTPFPFIGFSKASMLSPEGRCRAFDAGGRGYVRAEGGSLVFLKPLSRALADGDAVRAVIVGTGVNTNGRSEGLSRPRAEAQERLLREVYRRHGVAPRDLAYVEAHGTGTAAGDPEEAAAIGRALGVAREPGDPLPIGSAKTNIGHLEPAAGMAGVIKVVLALQNRAVPPSLHFETPNPDIPFDELNLKVVTEYTPLAGGAPAVMGVNSFGFGGANAHVVLREAPAAERRDGAGPEHGVVPLLLSARSGEALKATAERHLALLSAAGAPEPYDVAWTAATRRQRHPHRLAVFGAGRDELTRRLAAFVAGDGGDGVVSGRVVGRPARLALLFSGNGAQWPGMGRRLLASDPVFRAEVERIDELLRPLAGFSVIEELEAPAERDRLHLTGVAQPLLFALQLGLVESLRARGLVFEAVLGHSVGEVAAARAAGAFDLEQAVHVIHQRSAVQELTRGFGRMAAAALSPEAAAAELAGFGGEIELAAVNSPESVTLSGPLAALEELGRRLAARGVFFRILDLDYAFHSRVMEPVREPLLEALAGLEPGELAIPFVSSVTGGHVEGGQLGAEYWWRNVRSPVRLDRAMSVLVGEGFDVFLEVGPHPILQKYANENLRAAGSSGRSAYTLHRDSDDAARLWQVIGSVEVLGCRLDTARLFPVPGRRVALPAYPWQRERHWKEGTDESSGLLGVPLAHPLLGYRPAQTEGVWSNPLDLARVPYLADHVVGGGAIFPAAAFVEMALAAAEARSPGTSHELESLEIRAPLALAAGAAQTVRFTLAGGGEFAIESRPRLGEPEWTVHAAGRLASPSFRTPPPAVDPGAAMAAPAGARRIAGEEHRRRSRAIGLAYGPAFSGLREVVTTGDAAVARLELPPEVAGDAGRYRFHPCLLDAGLQVMVGLCAGEADSRRPVSFLPFSIGRLISYRPAGTAAICRVEVRKRNKRSVVADFRFFDSEGGTVAEIEGFRFRRARWVQEAGGEAGHYHYRPVLSSRRGRAAAAAPAPAELEPAELAGRVAPRLAEVAREHRRAGFYGQVLPLFDALVAGFALRAVDRLRAGRERFTADDLVAAGAVDPSQRALLEWLLAILAEDGLAEAGPAGDEEGGWTLADPAGQPEPEEIWRLILADYPAYAEETTLAGRTGLRLAEILRDGGGLPGAAAGGAAARLCDASPTWRLAAAAVQETLAAVVEAWPAGRRLRVLEIGGGGTDLAADLLASLPMDRCDYVFAAADERARSRAAAELADFAGHRVIQLGIDGDPAEQGLAAGDFDVVIADHALHAAAQPDLALAGLRRLLSEGGLLLALERSPERHTDLVLGIDSGWWRPAAGVPRPRPRTRPAEAWKRAAERQGFADVVEVAEPATGAAGSARACAYLLVARNPEAAAAAPEAPVPRAFLVLCDAEGEPAAVAAELTARLEAAGHRVVRAVAGAEFARAGGGEFTVAPKQPWELARLIETLRREGVEIAEVVHLMGLELDPGADSDLMELQDRRCTSTLHLVQALVSAEGAAPPRLWLVTAGAAALSPSSRAPGIGRPIPSQAPLWGLGRVLMNEHPELRCRLVDLSLDGGADGGAEGRAALAAELVAVELAHPDAEDEILLTAGARYGMRLERLAADAAPAPAAAGGIGDSERVRLDFADPGPLGNLGWHVEPRRPPGAGEIEVRVRATGLNFRDVMFAMGMLTDEAVENGFAGATLGMECAGDVVAVGAGVEGLAPGDRVMCFAPACFASHVTTGTTAVARMPEGWSYEEGATVPGVFLTVYYALDHLAQLCAGERILIHGAAGGVGLAAIQYARWKGAEIFATAGSEEKRDFLRLLGIEHVLDSRSLAFADEILERTGGEGVDVVLNFLSGEAVQKNLAVLKPFGRFLELGKRDFYENAKIGLRPFRNNISYFGIDADQLMVERPELAGRLYREVEELLARGAFRPLAHRVFPAGRAAHAFRHMQQSRQIGKVIVSNTPVAATRAAAATPAGLSLEPEASYLITGGLGGFGLATARWLAARGARSLVLAGRSGAARPEAAEAVAELEAAGVRVTVARADVARLDELRGLLDEIAAELPPLRGVVHGAMVLEDALVRNLDRRRLLRVLEPKILGARNLDLLTRDLPLDFFVLYSSATTCFGNPGQGNYVAANLYLEALAEERRAAGRPALAVGWGPITDVGVLADNPKVRDALLARIGGRPFTAAQALAHLERLLEADRSGVAVAALDWRKLHQGMPGMASPRFRGLGGGGERGDGARDEDVRELIAGRPEAEAQEIVTGLLREQMAAVLRMPAERIRGDSTIQELGMDSLMAVELSTAVEQRFGVHLSAAAVGGGATAEQIAARITRQLGTELGTAPAAGSPAGPDEAGGELLTALLARHGVSAREVDQVADLRGQ